MANSSSSRRWLKEHFSDPYVKQAQQNGLRSRSVYKLEQIQGRDHLFKTGMTVVDLGAAPGGWSIFVKQCVGEAGRVVALDKLPIPPIVGVETYQGDFTNEIVLNELLQQLGDQKIDWVISDMAPNFSGIASVDQPRVIALGEIALAFALHVLRKDKPGASGFLVKIFQGEGFDRFLGEIRNHFKRVVIRKPSASRGRSSEVYLLAREYF